MVFFYFQVKKIILHKYEITFKDRKSEDFLLHPHFSSASFFSEEFSRGVVVSDFCQVCCNQGAELSLP